MPKFQELLKEEAKTRVLRETDIMHCLHCLYHSLSEQVHGNDGTIVINKELYKPNERAALVALLKLQDPWDNPIKWREMKEEGSECGEVKNNAGIGGGQD